MALLDLANELLIQVVSYLPAERDINALTRCNRALYSLFNTYLYAQHIRLHESSALIWASAHGRESTLRRLLDLGADIHVKSPSDYRYDICGHPGIARILLEAGISDNEYARKREWIPLWYALNHGHDDVALVLLDHFSDINIVLPWTSLLFTTLHVASNLGLPLLVRLLLDKGADVHVEDANGMTALHYALLGSPATCGKCSEGAMFGMRKNVVCASKGQGYGSDVETVRMLMENGADLDKKAGNKSRRHQHSARQLARSHPDKEMRKLCGVDRGWLGQAMSWK